MAAMAILGPWTAAENIPPERLIAWDPGVRDGIPDYPVTIRLAAEDFDDGSEADAAAVIQRAIDESPVPGAVVLPEGTFSLKDGIRMKSGVVLRGQGLDRTRLIVNAPHLSWHGAINFQAEFVAEERRILGGYEAGSRELKLECTEGLAAGMMALIRSENDLDAMYGSNKTWLEAGTTWARRTVGQIVEITEVRSESVLIDTEARLSRMHLQPTMVPFEPVRDAGIEGLHIRRDDTAGDFIVLFARAVNCWVRDCELEFAMRSHVQIMHSRHLTIESNYIHHARNYGGGGHGYGISLGSGSSDCLIWNNVFRMLRHALLTGGGGNGNVWAYNHSQEQHQEGGGSGCDLSVHGHYPYMELFEGNRVEYAMSTDWWGAAGPLVTFFRNRLDTSTHAHGAKIPLRIQYASHRQNVIGNSLVSGQSIYVSEDSEDAWVEGNLVRGRKIWNAVEAFPLPPSLFLTTRPHFWDETPWPAIGADVDFEALEHGRGFHEIPAQQWARRILDEGEAMPFRQRHTP